MHRGTLAHQLAVALIGVVIVTACADAPEPITYDTEPPETVPETTAAPATLPVTAPSTTVPGDTVGETWVDATGNLVGLSSECGNLSFVSPRPDRRGLITGVALQGLWSSEDGGETWNRLGQATDSDVVTLRLTGVRFDPEDPTRFWVSGLYNGGGVYSTSDDGDSFQRLGDIVSADDVSVDLSDPGRRTLLASMHEQLLLLRSADGGESWEDISMGLPEEAGRVDSAMAIDSATYLVGTRDGPVSGIFRSTDSGATWERVHPAGVAGAPMRASDGNLYWLLERGAGVAMSADDGVTWTAREGRGISPFANSLIELPDGRFATLSDSTLIVSADHGETWMPVGPTLPYEPTGMTYAPLDSAFYVWHLDCDIDGDNPVRAGAIMRLDLGLGD